MSILSNRISSKCCGLCSHYWKSRQRHALPIASAANFSSQNATDKTAEADEAKYEQKKKFKPISMLENFLPSTVLNMIRGAPAMPSPTNLAFVDPKGGTMQMDADVPMEVIWKEAPKLLQQETKKLAQQVDENFHPFIWENPDLFKCDFEHGETVITYEFKTEKDMENWKTGCDSDWAEGYSKCDLYMTDRGTAIFEGTLSTMLVKDGRTDRAGWCTMKSIDTRAFERKKRYEKWDGYNTLLIKLRGDGRSYKVMLHTPEAFDITWGDSYSCYLHTHGGPYWQYERIPFSRFFGTMAGTIKDTQYPLMASQASSVSIVLMDKIDGPFRLEIGFIGATYDGGHTEKHAYESYNSPLAHPDF